LRINSKGAFLVLDLQPTLAISAHQVKEAFGEPSETILQPTTIHRILDGVGPPGVREHIELKMNLLLIYRVNNKVTFVYAEDLNRLQSVTVETFAK
jgi:hypothetical protein